MAYRDSKNEAKNSNRECTSIPKTRPAKKQTDSMEFIPRTMSNREERNRGASRGPFFSPFIRRILTIISIAKRLKIFRRWDMGHRRLSEWKMSERSDWRSGIFFLFVSFRFDNRRRAWCMNDVGSEGSGEERYWILGRTAATQRKHQKISLQYRPSVWKFIFVGALQDKWNYHEPIVLRSVNNICVPIRCLPFLSV